jgi:hypothetical protein
MPYYVAKYDKFLFFKYKIYLLDGPSVMTPLGRMTFRGFTWRRSEAKAFETYGEAKSRRRISNKEFVTDKNGKELQWGA